MKISLRNETKRKEWNANNEYILFDYWNLCELTSKLGELFDYVNECWWKSANTMENWCGIALTPLSATPSQNHSPVLTELSHSFSDGEFLLLKQGN